MYVSLYWFFVPKGYLDKVCSFQSRIIYDSYPAASKMFIAGDLPH